MSPLKTLPQAGVSSALKAAVCSPGKVLEIQKHLQRAQAESKGKATGQQKLHSGIPLLSRRPCSPRPSWHRGEAAEERDGVAEMEGEGGRCRVGLKAKGLDLLPCYGPGQHLSFAELI